MPRSRCWTRARKCPSATRAPPPPGSPSPGRPPSPLSRRQITPRPARGAPDRSPAANIAPIRLLASFAWASSPFGGIRAAACRGQDQPRIMITRESPRRVPQASAAPPSARATVIAHIGRAEPPGVAVGQACPDRRGPRSPHTGRSAPPLEKTPIVAAARAGADALFGREDRPRVRATPARAAPPSHKAARAPATPSCGGQAEAPAGQLVNIIPLDVDRAPPVRCPRRPPSPPAADRYRARRACAAAAPHRSAPLAVPRLPLQAMRTSRAPAATPAPVLICLGDSRQRAEARRDPPSPAPPASPPKAVWACSDRHRRPSPASARRPPRPSAAAATRAPPPNRPRSPRAASIARAQQRAAQQDRCPARRERRIQIAHQRREEAPVRRRRTPVRTQPRRAIRDMARRDRG